MFKMPRNSVGERRTARILRWGGFLWLASFLAWLPFEDVGVGATIILAALGAFWIFVKSTLGWPVESGYLRFYLFGILIGAATPLAAVFFMIFKSGMHSHGFSDFTFTQIFSALSIIPLGIIGGLVFSWVVIRAYIHI